MELALDQIIRPGQTVKTESNVVVGQVTWWQKVISTVTGTSQKAKDEGKKSVEYGRQAARDRQWGGYSNSYTMRAMKSDVRPVNLY